MKMINIKWTYLLASALLVCFSACSGNESVLEKVEKEGASRAELIVATVSNLVAGQLEAEVATQLKDNQLNVQKLTISGEFNADDAVFIRKLTNLQELDMADVTIKASSSTGESYYWVEDNAISSYMFQGFSKLTKLTFPTNITSIGESVCSGCTSLSSVTIPDGVKHIGSYAFSNCTSLTSIEIPSSVITMSWGTFQGDEELTTVKLLANIESIPSSMFSNCSKLETIELASGITRVEENAFSGCTALKDYTPFANITTIEGWGAFNSCSFASLNLSGVTSLGNGAFQNCSALATVILSESLTAIGSSAFSNTALTSITLPETLTTIGNSAFSNTSITEIDIPESVKVIESGAFESTKLTILTVPATVTTVTGSLVNYCSNFVALFWNSLAEVSDAYGIGNNCYLYLANGSISCGPNWKNIIIDGVAEAVELKTSTNSGDVNPFYCPKAFTAKKISYTRSFNQMTYPGRSAGWQTIVLPFQPTAIVHKEKGVIAPFGSEVEGAKPFWLRRLTTDGFADVTIMEADKPYIIAMPYNNEVYLPEYNLNGEVTFSAENVEIAVTPDVLAPDAGLAYNLQPTYKKVEKGALIYALNANYWINDYENGSVFARSSSDVYPFEAYAVPNDATGRAIYSIDTRSANTRSASVQNTTGVPAIGDM
ncbi:leucine-rich repeat domain-containing protein [Phocaeicola sp.]